MTEITAEQREAWERISSTGTHPRVKADLAQIASLLPSDLTEARPALPTKPGTRINVVSEDGDQGDFVLADNDWWMGITDNYAGEAVHVSDMINIAWSLVAVSGQVTRAQIDAALRNPDNIDRGTVTVILELVNGTDRA